MASSKDQSPGNGTGTSVTVLAGGSKATDAHGRSGTAVAGAIKVHPSRAS